METVNDTPAIAPDLSRQIEKTIAKEPRDLVKCVRVFDDSYRCNWWSPAIDTNKANHVYMQESTTNHTVRKSAFLTATSVGGEIKIVESPQRPK